MLHRTRALCALALVLLSSSAALAQTPPLAPAQLLATRVGARVPRGTYGAHGSDVWAVLLAAGSVAQVRPVFEYATNVRRLAATMGDRGCNAALAPEYPPSVSSAAVVLVVTFANRRDAQFFASALVRPPLWAGRMHVSCAD